MNGPVVAGDGTKDDVTLTVTDTTVTVKTTADMYFAVRVEGGEVTLTPKNQNLTQTKNCTSQVYTANAGATLSL